MNLFAVVFTDELERDGRGVIYFNVRTPNVNFRHYAVVQHKSGAQQRTIEALLTKVRVDYPKAGEEDSERAVWIVREQTPKPCRRCGEPDEDQTPTSGNCYRCEKHGSPQ
jgi:hypothetical protein